MENAVELGQNIERLLKLKKKSKVALANYLGVSKSAVGNWTKGTSYPYTQHLTLICEFLDVSYNELFGYVEKEQKLTVEEKILLKKYRSSPHKDAIDKLVDQ